MKLARDYANAGLHRLDRLALRTRLALDLRAGLTTLYQPNPFDPGHRQAAAGRACADRFAAFSKHLPADTPLSTIDVGCNIGYFVFRMAERGGLCLGVDWGRNEIALARRLAAKHNVANALFAQMAVTEKTAATLPTADLVICLSIFHHWARKLGLDGATAIMRGLAGHAGKYMVFETGQPDEPTDWASDLHFMGSDPQGWTQQYLSDLGFAEVTHLGEFPTSLSPIPRNLYLAGRAPE